MKKPVFKIEVRSCDGTGKLIRTYHCIGIRSAKNQFKEALSLASRFNMYVSALDADNNPVHLI